MNFYNLDMIISVGYRVNSKRATQFRIWATKVLKSYLLKGYVINQKRLLEVKGKFQELQRTILFLQEKVKKKQLKGQEKEISNLLANYAKTLTLLEQYDKRKLSLIRETKGKFVLQYKDAWKIIQKIKTELITKGEASDLFDKSPEKKLREFQRIFIRHLIERNFIHH